MTISQAVQKKPKHIARNLVSFYKDDAEQILYLAGNLGSKERDVLLLCVREVRVKLFNLRGHED